jgi:hypothetical protein
MVQCIFAGHYYVRIGESETSEIYLMRYFMLPDSSFGAALQLF